MAMVIRQTYWIDRDVQGILIGRVIVYAAAAALYLLLGNFCISFWQKPAWTLGQHSSHLFQELWPWLPSMLLLIPLVIHDVVRVSNLFAGPIYRLRQHLTELNRDPNCRPLKFRDDDYWQDLVAPINQLQNEILALRLVVDGLVKKQMAARQSDEGTSVSASAALPPDSTVDLQWSSGTRELVEQRN